MKGRSKALRRAAGSAVAREVTFKPGVTRPSRCGREEDWITLDRRLSMDRAGSCVNWERLKAKLRELEGR